MIARSEQFTTPSPLTSLRDRDQFELHLLCGKGIAVDGQVINSWRKSRGAQRECIATPPVAEGRVLLKNNIGSWLSVRVTHHDKSYPGSSISHLRPCMSDRCQLECDRGIGTPAGKELDRLGCRDSRETKCPDTLLIPGSQVHCIKLRESPGATFHGWIDAHQVKRIKQCWSNRLFQLA